MIDSNTSQPIFEKSAGALLLILENGSINDRDFLKAILAGFSEHNKIKNRELNEKKHNLLLARTISEGEVKKINEILKTHPA